MRGHEVFLILYMTFRQDRSEKWGWDISTDKMAISGVQSLQVASLVALAVRWGLLKDNHRNAFAKLGSSFETFMLNMRHAYMWILLLI